MINQKQHPSKSDIISLSSSKKKVILSKSFLSDKNNEDLEE